MEFKDLVKTQRAKTGKTLEEIGIAVGVSKATVQRWESGEIKNIRRDKIAKLAEALETTTSYLMDWVDPVPESIFSIPNILPMPKMKKVPRLGIIACGEPILAAENIETYDTVPDDIRCDFTLRCRGDSMINARIFDGDIVYIRAQSVVESGAIAVVLIGDDVTLKRIKLYDDHISLEPENPQYRPIVIWGEEMNTVRILGKAVYFTSAVR